MATCLHDRVSAWNVRIVGGAFVVLLLAYLVHTIWRLTDGGSRNAQLTRVVGIAAAVALCGFLFFVVLIFSLQN